MYLIVLDSNCVTSDRQYYICKGEYFKNIISIYPKLKDINENDIEEVLLCSFMKNLSQNHIKISKCKKISVTDCEIKITYDSIKTDNVYCGDVMGRIVGHLFAKKLKKNKKDPIPFIMLLEDYQDYLDIKENVVMIKYMSLMERVEYLKNKKEWANIVDLFPNEQEIEKENIWNKVECLKELSFALSKIIEPGYKKIDIREKKKYKDYFIKVINRCIELEPDKYNHKSILAYHYYITFSKEKNHKNNIYEKAETLYKYLINNSNEKYKELYRYTKLRQYNFDVIRWNCDARSRGLYVNEILKDFEKLINDYVFLSEYNQKKFKKYYIGALFGYCAFNIENFLNYYEVYIENKIFNKPIRSYYLNKEKLELINKIDGYLKIIVELREYDNENTFIDIKETPNYFQIFYRLAQIEQIKGLAYILKNKTEEEYNKFFENSNAYIKKIINLVDQKQGKERFLDPYYIKLVYAVNLHFLNKRKECHKKFNNAKSYMVYEQAVLYILQSEQQKALGLLKTIPQSDTCFNKTQKLIERITYEN